MAAAVGPIFVGDACIRQDDIVGLKNAAPSWHHLFGTDQYSRDIFARVLCGARISLSVGALAVVLSMTIGTIYGLVAGYFGGRVDTVLMRLLDGFLSIPRVLLLLAILTLWYPVPLWELIVLLGATGWFGVSSVGPRRDGGCSSATVRRSGARARREPHRESSSGTSSRTSSRR